MKKKALFMLLFRPALVGVFSFLTWLILRAVVSSAVPFPPGILLSGLSMFPVNAICLSLVSRWYAQEGESVKELLSPRPKHTLRDIGWGIVWLFVLFIPFIAAMMVTAYALFGPHLFTAFETIFYNPETDGLISPVAMLILGFLTVITFAPFNAPTEEAWYRGYAQSRLSKVWSPSVAILLSSLAFGIQHIFYAGSWQAAILYFAAFTAWGVCSGWIVHFQKRLFPVTMAHIFVNFFTTLPAVIVPILILTGWIRL